MSIKHDYTLNPVTALEIYCSHSASGTLILAGEGCYLKLFNAETGGLLRQLKIFEDQTIHGIAVRKNVPEDLDDVLDVTIWGGPCLAFFTRRTFVELLKSPSNHFQPLIAADGYYSTNASDWILNGLVSSHGQCMFVTAHNTVLRANVEHGSLVTEALSSPSRSILYSAHLAYESETSLLVAAGTVFGEIVVWRCLNSDDSSKAFVLHTLRGHEGSIFGVNISDIVIDMEGKPRRLLASCSDDRTIRVWEVNLLGHDGGRLPKAITGIETGFGDKKDKYEQSEVTLSTSLALVMGHASRIWSVQFLLAESGISVLSFGEDSTTQHWELENSGYSLLRSDPDLVGSKSIQAKLMHRNTFAFNSGKHLWSQALYPWTNGPAKVITGGADGKISLFETPFEASGSQSWNFQEVAQNIAQSPFTEISYSVEVHLPSGKISGATRLFSEPQASEDPDSQGLVSADSTRKPKPTPKKPPKDGFSKYAFISENRVLVTTTFGRVLIGNIDQCVQWSEIDMPAESNDLKSYSIVKSIRELGIAFLGSARGTIFLYHSGSIQEFGKIEGKVADMFAMVDAAVEVVATTLGGTYATLFKFPIEDASYCQTQKLKLLDKFVVTSAGKFSNRLVLGSRLGALAVYNPDNSEEPTHTWSPLSAVDAITSVTTLPSSPNSGYFLMTSRNGTYSIFSLTNSLSMVHQGTPPSGSIIESAWFSGTDLIMYGFKSNSFIIWNETQQCEVASIECGGAHRSYAYSPTAGSEGAGHFIYTKASKLYLHSQSRLSHQIIKTGGHGREIKACAVSPEGLIATGAEDTAIRIWKYDGDGLPTEKRFDCLVVVQKHTTGIQHLQWHGSSYLFSSGGNEEFFVWAVSEIPGFGTGILCEASCPDKTEEQDLRIMSFDVSSLAISNDGSETLLISLAYSDSTIRCYTYSKAELFSLVAKGQYKSSCLTQLRYLVVGDDLFFLTAGTDGCLTAWKASMSTVSKNMGNSGDHSHGSLSMLSTHRLHQNSIKALDVATKGNKIIVATGGDDNALGVTIYDADHIKKCPKSIILSSAHAAAITGLSFVASSSSGTLENMRIITSSNDQRVKEWELSIVDGWGDSSGNLKDGKYVRKVGDVFTSVADVGDVAALKVKGKSKVLVVGNGMEVYGIL